MFKLRSDNLSINKNAGGDLLAFGPFYS